MQTIQNDSGEIRLTIDPNTTQLETEVARHMLAAGKIILHLLEMTAEDGDYIMRVNRQVTWRGNPKAPYKLSATRQDWLFVVVKPPESGNGSVFEYMLRAQGGTKWNSAKVETNIRNHIAELNGEVERPERLAVVADSITVSKPVEPKLPAPTEPAPAQAAGAPLKAQEPEELPALSESVKKLEELAGRNNHRQARLAELATVKAEEQSKLAAIQQRIADLEEEELKVIEQMENDRECMNAQTALATLRTLMRGTV